MKNGFFLYIFYHQLTSFKGTSTMDNFLSDFDKNWYACKDMWVYVYFVETIFKERDPRLQKLQERKKSLI